MATHVRSKYGVILATCNAAGTWHCAYCPVWLQRTASGSIEDGVTAHYRVVHPERKIA